MKAWIDIDNPPQVQYLAPFVNAFQRRGLDVLVTARDYGITTALLESRSIAHHAIGREFGASRLGKLRGTVGRALRLVLRASRGGRPTLLLSTSRSSAMAAWMLRVPSFMVLDYEHAELNSFRTFGTTVLHPNVIDSDAFRRQGFDDQRLVAFSGIKEDISFAGRDIEGTVAHDFGVERDGLTFVLVRPPSETSHYFDAGSRQLTGAVLAKLAADSTVQLVFSPRHADQVQQLATYSWPNEPIVLERPVEFVSLLKAVDWVVCAGGTMLREAAYLGVPAISIFRSDVGAVDRWLEGQGLVRFVERAADLDDVDWHTKGSAGRLPDRGGLVDELVDEMLARASGR